MKVKNSLLLGFLLSVTPAFTHAQTESTNTGNKSKVGVWLDAGIGIGFADTYDNGTAPMSLYGLAAGLQTAVTVEWNRCHIQGETRGLAGALFTPLSGYDFCIQDRLEFLYRVHDDKTDRFHVWVGGAGVIDLDIKMIQDLMNASAGFSVFGNLGAVGMVQYDFGSSKDGSRRLFSLYGKLTLPLVGLAGRPGYAYIDNFTGSLNSLDVVMNEYEWFAKAFPGVTTDIGIYLNLRNGNRFGISYRWDYLSTGNRGIYRFDRAFHTINLDFMFKLN